MILIFHLWKELDKLFNEIKNNIEKKRNKEKIAERSHAWKLLHSNRKRVTICESRKLNQVRIGEKETTNKTIRRIRYD